MDRKLSICHWQNQICRRIFSQSQRCHSTSLIPYSPFWYHALVVYYACHLAKPKQDRVLAVAGLAEEVAQILARSKQQAVMEVEVRNDVYISGLWLRAIHHGLLWEQDHLAKSWTIRIDEAPSWSWGSLITPVKWPEKAGGTQDACRINGVCLQRRDDKHGTLEHYVGGKQALRPVSQRDSGITRIDF